MTLGTKILEFGPFFTEFGKVQEFSFPMITKTIDFFQLMPERERVKDAYSPHKDLKVSKFGQFTIDTQ